MLDEDVDEKGSEATEDLASDDGPTTSPSPIVAVGDADEASLLLTVDWLDVVGVRILTLVAVECVEDVEDVPFSSLTPAVMAAEVADDAICVTTDANDVDELLINVDEAWSKFNEALGCQRRLPADVSARQCSTK